MYVKNISDIETNAKMTIKKVVIFLGEMYLLAFDIRKSFLLLLTHCVRLTYTCHTSSLYSWLNSTSVCVLECRNLTQ